MAETIINLCGVMRLLLPVQRAGGDCPWLKSMIRRGRDLPSAALDGGGGDADVARCTAAGERRRGGAHAGHMERESAGSAAVMARIGGNAHSEGGPGCSARLPDGGGARWRGVDEAR